jgi:putative heme iron utilization protein
MNSLKAIRYVGGFARAGNITVEEYLQAKPDPLSAFVEPIVKHMNEDHFEAIADYVRYYVGVPCTEAKMISIDHLGMMVMCF